VEEDVLAQEEEDSDGIGLNLINENAGVTNRLSSNEILLF